MKDRASVFDIETWVDWDFVRSAGFRDPLEQSYAPNESLKDPLKIAAHHTTWWMNERNRWALHPLTARICSIAWGDLWSDEIECVASHDERQVIEAFAVAMQDARILTGFYVRKFDIPFVTARASVLGIRLPNWWPHERDYRLVSDIADVASKGKLDSWLLRCGLPAKTAAGDAVELMPLHEIETYNRNDVHVERLLARRFAPNMPALRATQDRLESIDFDQIPQL